MAEFHEIIKQFRWVARARTVVELGGLVVAGAAPLPEDQAGQLMSKLSAKQIEQVSIEIAKLAA